MTSAGGKSAGAAAAAAKNGSKHSPVSNGAKKTAATTPKKTPLDASSSVDRATVKAPRNKVATRTYSDTAALSATKAKSADVGARPPSRSVRYKK